jgi:hypothetical protein
MKILRSFEQIYDVKSDFETKMSYLKKKILTNPNFKVVNYH